MRRGEGDHFDDCAWGQGFDSRMDGRSLVAADMDGDGDLDLVLWNRVQPKLQLPVKDIIGTRVRHRGVCPSSAGAFAA